MNRCRCSDCNPGRVSKTELLNEIDESYDPEERVEELEDKLKNSASAVLAAWHGLEEGQARGEVQEDLAAIAQKMIRGVC